MAFEYCDMCGTSKGKVSEFDRNLCQECYDKDNAKLRKKLERYRKGENNQK